MTEDDTDPLDSFADLPPYDPSADHAVSDSWLRDRRDAYEGKVGYNKPIEGLEAGGTDWYLGLVGIGKTTATHRHGYGGSLDRESRFYKRWFEYPDLNGWMIIFRIWDRNSAPGHPGFYETPAGWVPPEREREADHWIAFLNQEIRARLRESGQTPKDPDPSQGAIPPPAPPGPVPVPPLIDPGPPPSKLFPAGLAAQGRKP